MIDLNILKGNYDGNKHSTLQGDNFLLLLNYLKMFSCDTVLSTGDLHITIFNSGSIYNVLGLYNSRSS